MEILHICYPYFSDFVKVTQEYIKKYKPKYTVIHSTIPVGITRECGENVFHSPVRGIHPDLEEGMRTFVKYLAPPSKELKEYFNKAGIKIMEVEKPEITEALKIWSTTAYGWNIVFEKELYKWCERHNLDFNIIYVDATKTYNEGYSKLGMKNVVRPILREMKGKIGGHCIMPNCELLKDSEIAKIIIKLNKKY